MMKPLQAWRTPLLTLAFVLPLTATGAVQLTLDGMNSTLDNGLLKVRFGADGSAKEVWKGGTNLISRLSGAARDPDKKSQLLSRLLLRRRQRIRTGAVKRHQTDARHGAPGLYR
ncbi:hypothetical protein OS21_16600 [Dickeya oryzae]